MQFPILQEVPDQILTFSILGWNLDPDGNDNPFTLYEKTLGLLVYENMCGGESVAVGVAKSLLGAIRKKSYCRGSYFARDQRSS